MPTASLVRFIALCWLCALAALPARAAWDDEPATPLRVGRLVDVQGTVWLYNPAQAEWFAAQPNRPLTRGDRLATDVQARAALRIGTTTLRLAGATEIELRRLDDRAIEIALQAGSVGLHVTDRAAAAQAVIETGEGRFAPLGTGRYRIDRRANASSATAWRGALRFEGVDSTLDIGAGQRAELWLPGPGQATHYIWLDIERDDFAAWFAAAASVDERDADRAAAMRYVSPEMIGWEDLDRHGRWESHPEWGGVWIPAAVPPGWAPYRFGQWAWIAPWGWTWVDAAPWGFAPFHYGRWVWWRQRWCWTPGPRVPRPAWAPALVGWVGAPPPRPGHGAGPSAPPNVGWVPLGPRDAYRPPLARDGHDARDARDARRPREPHDWRETHDPRDPGDSHVPRPPTGRDARPGTAPLPHDSFRPAPATGPAVAPGTPVVSSNQAVPGAVTVAPRDAFGAGRTPPPAGTAEPGRPMRAPPPIVVRTEPAAPVAPIARTAPITRGTPIAPAAPSARGAPAVPVVPAVPSTPPAAPRPPGPAAPPPVRAPIAPPAPSPQAQPAPRPESAPASQRTPTVQPPQQRAWPQPPRPVDHAAPPAAAPAPQAAPPGSAAAGKPTPNRPAVTRPREGAAEADGRQRVPENRSGPRDRVQAQ